MKLNNVANFDSIDDYVEAKLAEYSAREKSFETLFEFMFSEKNNVMAEFSDGYRIKKQTYGEVKERILRSAPALDALIGQLPHDSLVGIYMSNSIKWIEVFWQILICGYRPLLMNTRLPDETLEDILSLHKVGAVISDGKTFSVKTVISDEITECDAAPVSKDFGTEVLFMSSGTTDRVKLCAYTGENFFWQICDSRNIIKQCPQIKEHYKGELKQLTLLPFYHVFGFIAVYLWFGFFSRTFVFPKDLNPATVQNTIKKHEVTHIFAVPMVWERIYKAALRKVREKGDATYKKFRFALSLSNSLGSLGDAIARSALKEVRENLFGDSVRFLISGGGGLAPDVFRFFNGIGYHLANGYGMTEIGITSVEKSNSKKLLNSASVGAPFGYTEYRVTESGELTVRGRTMASRILTGDEERITDFDAWFETKDLVCVKNGRYYINGRVDDLIVCANGENLNPTLLEPTLKVEGCDAVCLFALDGGVPVLIASVLGCFSQTQLNAVFDRLDGALIEAKLEKTVAKVVLTSDGLMEPNDFKVSRRKVKQKYLSGAFNLIERGSIEKKVEELLSDLEREVIECFAKALERSPEEIPPSANFFLDLGGTSLDYFTLLGILKDKYGVSLPDDDKEKLLTVRDFCEFIKN